MMIFDDLDIVQQLMILKKTSELCRESFDPILFDEILFMINKIQLPEIISSGEITGVA